MRPVKATGEQIDSFLEMHRDWAIKDNKLHREYLFKDFAQAFKFMTKVAVLAEQADHHPEWFNVYNRLTVDLVTHDIKGITELDFELADKMETLFRQMAFI